MFESLDMFAFYSYFVGGEGEFGYMNGNVLRAMCFWVYAFCLFFSFISVRK